MNFDISPYTLSFLHAMQPPYIVFDVVINSSSTCTSKISDVSYGNVLSVVVSNSKRKKNLTRMFLLFFSIDRCSYIDP